MRRRAWERDRVLAGIAEHHSLVAGSLLFGMLADHSSVNVCALFVYGRDYSAGIRIELVFGAGVAYLADYSSDCFLDVHVGVVRADLTAHYDQT